MKITLINGTARHELTHIGEDAEVSEALTGEQTISFTVLPEDAAYLSEDTLIEFDGQLYDVASLRKYGNDLAVFAEVYAEHVTYRLNDPQYNVESFAFSGSYSQILSRILSGTPFSVGSTPTGTISNPTVIENASRREVLSTAADLMGCEIEYDGWAVNLVRHRGATTRVSLPDGENVTAVEVSKNRVEGTTSYTILLGKRGSLNVGDEVHIRYQPLGLDDDTRIIAMRYHPYNPSICSIEVGDYVPSVTDVYVDMARQVLYKSDAEIVIEAYVNSEEGKAAISSALSGTYVTVDALDNYATVSAVNTISQKVNSVESAITLSTDFSKNTIGTNVAALLQMVSNANSSQIKLKADYIQMTGTTTFLKASDVGAGGSTVIDGGRIATGQISADRIDLSSLHVVTVYFDDSTNYPVIKSQVYDDDGAWSTTEVGIQNPSVNSRVSIYGKSIDFREYTYGTPTFQLEINPEYGYVNANSFDVYINRVFVGDAGSGFLYYDYDNEQLRYQNLWSGRNTVIAN